MLLKNSIKPVFIISLFFTLLVSAGIYSQDSITGVKNLNNSVKIFIVLTPIPFNFSVSAGYERFINRSHAIELTGSYFIHKDEMDISNEILCLYPGYNYYLRPFRNKGPFFRLGGYLKYANKFPDEYGRSHQIYGAGVIAGIRLYFSKDHDFAFDFACGASADYVINKHEYFLESNYSEWQPSLRPQMHFTIRF